MLTTAATAAEDVVGPNAVTRAVHDAGQGIIDRNPTGIRSLRDLADSPWLAVKESMGQFAPQIAAVAMGGAAGAKAGAALGSLVGPAGTAVGGAIGGAAGSLLPIFTQEYGGIRQEQKESGQEDKVRALAAAIPATALERVGMGKALNVLKGVPGGAAGTILKEAGKGVLKEGATEGAQTVIEQWGAFKDPTKAESLEDTALSAAMGGIGGGVISAGAGAVDGMRHRAQERAEVQARQSAEAAAADAQARSDAIHEEQRAAAGQVAADAAAVRSGVLADEEGVQPEVLQTTPPDGRAVLESRRAADRAQASPDDEIYQSTGADDRTAPPVSAELLQSAAEPMEPDPRTPSQRMGINPDAGPLSRNVATAMDSVAELDAHFIGATGRDLQVRRTGPGVADESNVIDVQGRVVEDRVIGMPRRLATDTAEGLPVAAGVAEPINRTGEAYADGMAKAKKLDTKAHPLSKTWPEPDYQKLLEGGAPVEAVSMARALREAVPTKPQSTWKLKGWAAKVEGRTPVQGRPPERAGGPAGQVQSRAACAQHAECAAYRRGLPQGRRRDARAVPGSFWLPWRAVWQLRGGRASPAGPEPCL